MENLEIENILDKRVDGRKEEYLLKWKIYRRPQWIQKKYLSCDELLVKFEKSRGPQILGAKRNGVDVTYLVKDDQTTHEIRSTEAFKTPIPFINFLQSKIVFDDVQDDMPEPMQTGFVEPRNAVGKMSKVTYVTKGLEGFVYFFEYKNGDLITMSEVSAMVHQPHLVLKYLENAIEPIERK